MPKSPGWWGQFHLFLGAVLLISSSFLGPMAAASASQGSAGGVMVLFNGPPPIPPGFFAQLQIASIPGPPSLASVFGLGGFSSPAILAILHGETTLPAQTIAPEGAGGPVVMKNSEMPPAAPESSIVSVLVKTGLFGLFGTTSMSVVAAGPSSAGGQIVMQTISENIREPGSIFYARTEGADFLSSSGMAESGSVQTGPVAFQVTYISTFSPSSLQSYSSLTSVTSAIPGLWLDSSKRRSRSQIYVEILELMKRGPLTPFEIAFYARLNHKRTKEYAEFLKRSGYLETVVEDGRLSYLLSKKGMIFLEAMKNLFETSGETPEYANYGFSTQR
jgi:predicted transcriptional regulator